MSGVAAAGLALDGILAPAAAAAGVASATQPATAQAEPVTAAETRAPDAAATARHAVAGPDAAQAKAATAWLGAPPARTTALQTGTAQPAPATTAPGTAGAVGGTLFALLFVLALIFALAWLARRLPGVAGSSHRALRVVASLSLGPRERVVVVDVGGTQLLLGVGAGGTRALHTLDAPLPEAEAPRAPAFAQLLAQHFGKKP